ncbi:hypothetical protein [Amycolatopsis sp. WQ 127309]|uniref:hypothetical protein n=1 Tax=Amycolatopsis sp. WQ 127309 TaxID=2932773 RepID=UPI001FF69B1F|nr:hypothetical protein [Amycolatopsis sp. WQ 127309]UOZ06899.1 hypothetical protein MUY22_00985 [Amycolatopsis sp. WQ 127309]
MAAEDSGRMAGWHQEVTAMPAGEGTRRALSSTPHPRSGPEVGPVEERRAPPTVDHVSGPGPGPTHFREAVAGTKRPAQQNADASKRRLTLPGRPAGIRTESTPVSVDVSPARGHVTATEVTDIPSDVRAFLISFDPGNSNLRSLRAALEHMQQNYFPALDLRFDETGALLSDATRDIVEQWALARLEHERVPAVVAGRSGGLIAAHRIAALYNTAPGPEPHFEPGGVVHWTNQAHVRTTWPPSDPGLPLPDVLVSHATARGLRPIAGMDGWFPWRALDNPLYAVEPEFAGPDGDVHPAVRARAGEITAKIGIGRNVLQGISEDPDDPRLPELPRKQFDKIIARLQSKVVRDLKQLVRNSANPTRDGIRLAPLHPVAPDRPIYVGRVRPHHTMPQEKVIVGQYGAFLTDPPGSTPAGLQPSFTNSRYLGFYAAALIGPRLPPEERKAAMERWREEQDAARYLMQTGAGKNLHYMTADAGGNSTAFANAPSKPAVRGTSNPRAGREQVDFDRVNTVLLGFEVSMPDKFDPKGFLPVGINVLVPLDNAFDPEVNPFGVILLDYGNKFDLGVPVKDEPE